MALVRSTVTRSARWVSRFFRLLERWAAPRKSVDPRHQLGRQGEKLAARILRKKGYKVLYRNFRPKRGGEIDLVCRHGQTLVFVEVKTRASLAFGRPSEAVDHTKQQRLMDGAATWLRLLDKPETVHRFDIVEVIFGAEGAPPECVVIPNAFPAPETSR